MAPQSFGNWVFEKKLGSGGFGQVELWKEKNTNKRIAIKICILPKDSITQKQLERWQEEVRNLKFLNHINIVKSAPLPREMRFDGPILCMEYCNGGDLRKFLKRPEHSCGLLQSEVLSVMKDISSAICFLHSLPTPITHRDIKPENIVLHKQQNGTVIYKLIDLGYAKNIGNKTVTASLVGTFCYVAPELFRTNRYTSSVDYWSLGILFFEVLTGYKPFMPYTENLVKWMEAIQRKQYEEICAREVNERILFYNYIIHPTDLSEHALSDLVEWFQVALQSDLRKRGKCRSSGEVVIFSLLKKIFPRRTINIFSVHSYRISGFNVESNTTLLDAQEWIETTFSISINEQEIVNSSGIILNERENSGNLLLKDIPDSLLYVFKKSCLRIPQLDNDDKLPEMLDILLVQPKEIKEHSQLRQCFTAIIYIMRQEVGLFKQYIFALGVKLDIIKNKLHILDGKVQKNLPKIEFLLKEVQSALASVDSNALQSHWKGVNDLWNKVKAINSTVTNIKADRERLVDEISNTFDAEKLLQSLQVFTTPYEKFLEAFRVFEAENQYCSEKIVDKVNELSLIIGDFFEQKIEQFESPDMESLVRQLTGFELKLNRLSEGIKSSIELMPYYEGRLAEFNVKNQNSTSNNNHNMTFDLSASNGNHSLFVTDDAEIRDNIVLRTMLDQRLQDLKKSLDQFQMNANY